MKLNLYSPVDGEIKNIQDCNDSIFADRMLGDGLVIIPKSNNFKGFFDNAKVTMIFDTYHAYGFDVEGLQFLIHCGMDTVLLKGEGFATNLKVGDKVTKDDDIFSVDLDLLKRKKIVNETPIVFEFNNLSSYQINNLKLGQVNQGDLICTIDYKFKSKKVEKDLKTITDPAHFFNMTNKYEKCAASINKLIGTQSNYNEVYNCMTRLRFSVKNKELVNIDEIQKLDLIKGTVWNGNELQIIIGQDVYKLKEEIINLNSQSLAIRTSLGINSSKVSLGRKFLTTFAAIMVKMIPIGAGVGLIQAIIAILMQTGVMPNIVFKLSENPGANDVLFQDAAIGWVILFAMGKSTIYFIGIMVAVASASHFKLEGLMGIALGLILCCPFIFGDGGQNGMGNEFLLFDLGKINTGNPILDQITKIKVTSLSTKVFVIAGAIYTAKIIDTWLKRVIPITLELMFRPFIVIMIVVPLSFFCYGIIWNFIEVLFGSSMFYLTKIPLGIGVGIFVAIWQVTVIFGLHMVLGLIAMLDYFSPTTGGQTIYGISSISVWAQVGALIGVILVTQNAKLKKQGIGMLPAGLLGITEPILYGINLPKRRPLISGVCGAFFAGAFANIVGVTQRAKSGIGVFEAIGFFSEPVLGGVGKISSTLNGLFYLLACLMSVLLSLLFSMMSYKERESEKTLFNKTINKLRLLTMLELNLNKSDSLKLKKDLNQIVSSIDKENLQLIKSVEKNIQTWLKTKVKLNNILEIEELAKEKILTKGKNSIKNKKFNLANLYMEKYKAIDNSQKINLLKEKIDEQYKLIDLERLNKNISELEKKIMSKLNKLSFLNKDVIKDLEPIIFNNLNSIQIYYGLLDNKNPNINLNEKIDELKKEKNLLKKELKLSA
ncbi:glucose PTS transporter subunit IIA [Spiroplasma cantharicola]|uniref:PTS system, beta-glucoside-specific IIABC component n=1 Tax=Spiroplasma cantharicola TaxID=362837 RepID=A0A0M4JSF0_9MOLU|nr:glucose PTS transporter subunit IIA [Spiroplasma cantharicola]ALD66472.1 PTS system, beta-glucoside-specific IIABC component [Spiroplasma cantharicola]